MKVLIIKTSSMGDIIHTLPALTDAQKALPHIRFDWVVEEAFVDMPAWHPAVDRVIPVAMRRWKKNIPAALFGSELRQFRKQLKQTEYDVVIDAQGLIKSALIAWWANTGVRAGFSRETVREPLAARFYHHTVPADKIIIPRLRHLFASVLGYDIATGLPDYGIQAGFDNVADAQRYAVFFHGTAWENKLWPESYWILLLQKLTREGLRVYLPWGSDEERQRAERLAGDNANAELLPRLSIQDLAIIISKATVTVGMDTGLSHLAAALEVPSVSIYGPTLPPLDSTRDKTQHYLVSDFECAPCFKRQCQYQGQSEVMPACFSRTTVDDVWKKIKGMI